MHKIFLKTIFIGCFVAIAQESYAQKWNVETRSPDGPIALVTLPDAGGKRRTVFIAFEYSRKCDPIFSYAEITGNKFGKPVDQSLLSGTKIGVLVNGKLYTWHAVTTKYDNGYEAGFGITNELFELLNRKMQSMTYITPNGVNIDLPIDGFNQAIRSAFSLCERRFK